MRFIGGFGQRKNKANFFKADMTETDLCFILPSLGKVSLQMEGKSK